jgi:xanthine/uracil permease
MTGSIFQKPFMKLTLINLGLAIGLWVAYRRGYKGTDLLALSILSLVFFNAVGGISIWIGEKFKPSSTNNFLVPLWIAVGLLLLVYLFYNMFPTK